MTDDRVRQKNPDRLLNLLRLAIDQHLLEDVRRMRAIDELTYPIALSIFAGIEFLGALSAPRQDSLTGSRRSDFVFFWSTFLYPVPSPRSPLGGFVYETARNGLAHMGLTKGRLFFSARDPQHHLTLAEDGAFWIDAGTLAEDFEQAYRERFQPLAAADLTSGAGRMTGRLDKIWDSYQRDFKLALAGVSPIPSPDVRIVDRPIGSSTSQGAE